MDNGNGSVILVGVGSYVPARVLTNADLAKMVDTTDEWIRTRTGIRERRIAEPGETTSDMAVKAAQEAIKCAGIRADEIEVVVTATITPDLPFPSTSCLVQSKLGLRKIPVFDISAACSGFLYSLEIAGNFLRTGRYKYALVIGAEKLSSITNWEDRATCVLFGDGAGAAVLQYVDTPNVGIIGTMLGADGDEAELLSMPAGGSAKRPSQETVAAGEHFLKMQGNMVFKSAVRVMAQCAAETLEKHGLKASDIALVVPHQANNRIIEALSERLGIGMDRFKINLDRFGNTSAASIPIALDEAYRNGRIKSGDYILLIAFGAGLTWASTLLKWQ
ncbi:MAG: beta-ketoacyl-ACP synthase III [Verrucomicrobiota bacterium]|nr:beta-ketoacyl-ACP synthase III [Verrucomicrobiota bacterium]